MHGDEFYPPPLVIFELAESCHRLADAIGEYQKHLAGKPLREVETGQPKLVWLSLVDSLYRTSNIGAGGGSLLSPDGDDETEGWEHSIALSDSLQTGQRFMRILKYRLRNALPSGMNLIDTVVRWYAKATSDRGRNKRARLLAWWAALDGFDEFADEIRQSTRGLNSTSWNEALRHVTEQPNVTIDELEDVVKHIIADRQRGHDDNFYQDVWTGRFLLRVEQRRELADPSALFPGEGDYWDRFDVLLEESFTWPDLDDFLTGRDDKELREDIEALALGPLDYDSEPFAAPLGLWVGAGFADSFDLWIESGLETHLGSLYRAGWRPENRSAVTTEQAPPAIPEAPPADGPLDGNRFRLHGVPHEFTHKRWQLLNAMWGRDFRNRYDVETEIWDGFQGGDTLKALMRDLTSDLRRIGYPRFISKVRSDDSLVWKDFPQCAKAH